jgi:murein DD-endopeptidase MepM/ murein hydrolase activator NlpD
MIFSPLPGTPLIMQGFGQNPADYAPFGLAGHNGIDFSVPEGTVIYAPHDGVVTMKDHGDQDYGLHVIIEDTKRKSWLCHLSHTDLKSGQSIAQGDPIGLSGRSGNATGPHLHWTYQIMKNGAVQNKDNGFQGAVDVTEFTRLWLDKDLHHDAEYHESAKEYLTMTFTDKQYLKNTTRVA